MKTVTLVLAGILILGAPTLFAEDERKEISLEDAMEAICGTWVNTEYGRRTTHSQKITRYPDGRWEAFYWESHTTPTWTGTSTVTEQWTDSEGNTWYRAHWNSEDGLSGYELGKVNKTETVLEYVNSPTDYPTKIDPNDSGYHIFYRK